MISLNCEGRAKLVRFVDLPPSAETDLGTITLDAPVHVRGRFVDPEGRPVSGRHTVELAHEIVVLPYSTEDPSGSEAWEGRTQFTGNADGTFEGDWFGRARYLLTSIGRPIPMDGGSRLIRPTVVDCTLGSVDELLITADRAFKVTVRPEVDETRDFAYSILDANGTAVHHGDLTYERTWYLPSGDYRLLVGPDGAHTREIPFTVASEPVMVPVEP
jgi:hypothetical protein